ncbi:MAG: methylamine methyltransferase corrinoid protein reductive activase [Methanomassiliicoccales archaeon]|nr:methylamine methyltransferase corrinoid protein reductive activase [Methanomassiliicoccales archaeon]
MKDEYGIAIDIGTSGLRAQSIDLKKKEIIATTITMRHPVPGANVMDHLDFAINVGKDTARSLILETLNMILRELKVDLRAVTTVAVCGNPIQLSLFQDIEIRDLAFAGERAKKKLGVENIKRDACVLRAGDLGLEVNAEADVFVPPAVKHEIGADALAMMYKTDFLTTNEIAMVTDYGTNAEMALKVGDEIVTGSAAAGPAIEGQHVSKGMLAAPGAISDIENMENDGFMTFVLDKNLFKRRGAVVDPLSGNIIRDGELQAKGITGTGVVALVSTGLDAGLMKPGRISNDAKRILLQNGIVFDEHDLKEVGKTIAAFTAGHITLAMECGISLKDIKSMYMTGASGTYVDAKKSMKLGLVPGTVEKVRQVGNTSLAMSCDIVKNPDLIDSLQEIADSIRSHHVMFAESKVFENAFAVELGVWTQGMPFDQEDKMRKHFGIEPRPPLNTNPDIRRIVERDINELGKFGLTVVEEVGVTLEGEISDCVECERCVKACNEDAIRSKTVNGKVHIVIDTGKCLGTACRRCERACKNRLLHIDKLSVVKKRIT